MAPPAAQSLLFLAYTYVFPLVLVSAALFRDTLASFLYLVGFLLALVLQPDALLRGRKIASLLLCATLVLISLSVLTTELVLWIMDTQDALPTTANAQEYIPGEKTVLQYLQMILPDTLVAVTSALMGLLVVAAGFRTPNVVVQLKRGGGFASFALQLLYGAPNVRKLRERFQRGKMVAVGHQYLTLIVCLTAGICFSSVTTIVYLLIGLASLVLVTCGVSIDLISSLSWPVLLVLSALDMMYMYLAQFEYNGTSIAPIYVSGTDGAVQWMAYDTWEWASMWYIFAEFATLIVLFFMVTHRLKMRAVGKAMEAQLKAAGKRDTVDPHTSAPDSDSPDPETDAVLWRRKRQVTSVDRLSRGEEAENPLVKKYFAKYGWQAAFFFYMISTCLTPSLIQAPVLFWVMFGGTLMPTKLIRASILPLFLYSTLFLLAQGIYCIPFSDGGDSDVLLNLGFVLYSPVAPYLGMQVIPVFILALSWHNRKYAHNESSDIGTEREKLLKKEALHAKNGPIVAAPGDEIVHAWDKSKRNVLLVGKILKTFVLKQAYLISLLAVMLCSLSSVNLFNLCYMIFFTAFFVSRKAAHRLWILLVLYTEVVIMVEFLWQMTWTEDLDGNAVPNLFGLTHFDLLLKGIGFHIAIWVFAVIQLWIGRQLSAQKKRQAAKEKAMKNGDSGDEHNSEAEDSELLEAPRVVPKLELPPRLAYAKQVIENLLPQLGLAITYVIMFTVGVIPQYDCFSLCYLLVVYTCLTLHMLFVDARTKIRWFWPAVVLASLIMTLSLYFYQFPQIASWLQDLWPDAINKTFTLDDIGLHELDDLEQYVALLGTSLVFVASVLQLRSFIVTPKTESHSNFESIANGEDGDGPFHWIRIGLFLAKRFMILHMFKVTLLVMWLAAISSVDVLNLGFALLSIWSLFFWEGPNTVGALVVIYAELCTFVAFAVEFYGVNYYIQEFFFPNDEDGERYTNFLQYLGVEQGGNLFLEVAWFNVVILLLLLERFAARWKKDPDIVVLETRNGEPCPLFLVTKDQFESTGAGELDADSPLLAMERIHAVRYRMMWYASNIYRLFGIIIFTLSLLLTIFLRVNVWSIVEIFLVGACVLVPTLVKKNSPLLLIALGFLLIWEYVSYLGLPPDLWPAAPWSDLSEATLAWLTFGGANYNIYLTLTDYVTLLFLMLLYRNEYYFQAGKLARAKVRVFSDVPAELLQSDGEYHSDALDNPLFEESAAGKYILDDAGADDDPLGILATSLSEHQAPDNTFEFNSFGDRVLYIVLRYSLHLIMVCIFMFATVQANLLSAGYVVFSLFFLYYDEMLYQKRNKLWNFIRFYNFLVLLAQICFQCPYFPYNGEPYSAQQILGLYKYDDLASVFSTTGAIFDIIIFVLVTIQATVFESQVFVRIANEVQSQRANAIGHAQKRYREFVLLEHEAVCSLEREKKERRERLLAVKSFRMNKKYLEAENEANRDEKAASDREWQATEPDHLQRSTSGGLFKSTSTAQLPPSGSTAIDLMERPSSPLSASTLSVSSSTASVGAVEKVDDEDLPVQSLDDTPHEDCAESDSDSDDEEPKVTLKDKVVKKLLWALEAGYNALVNTLFKIGGRDPDPRLNKAQTIGLGCYYLIVSKSQFVVYLLFVLNNLVYGTVVSQLFFLGTFAFALLERPQPSRGFWRGMLLYVNLLLVAKFVFQVSVFCVCYATFNWYLWCVEPLCSNDDYCSESYQDPTIVLKDLPRTFGIEKIDGVFVFAVAFDLLVLVLLLIHRNNMKVSGNWLFLTELWEKSKLEYFAKEQKNSEEKKKEKAVKKREKEEKKRRTTLKKYRAQLLERRTELLKQQQSTEEVDAELLRVKQKLSKKARLEQELLPVAKEPSSVSLLFTKLKNKVKRKKKDGGESDSIDDHPQEEQSPEELLDLDQGLEQMEVDDSDGGAYEAEVLIADVAAEGGSKAVPLGDSNADLQVIKPDQEEKAAASALGDMGKAKRLLWSVKFYYHNLFRQHPTASDYYVALATVEVLCFFYMLLFQNTFTYQPPDGWTFILLENSVPTSFFFLLLIEFIFTVLDRTVYIYRSVKCKVLLQYTTLAYYTTVIFYVLPSGHEEEFTDLFLLQVFYLMKCVYWWISALQIADGYPPNIQKRWLTSSYSQPMYYVYQVYMIIPFLFELRSLLDWTVHETTLRFLDWMKLEDIYSSLYMTKCKREKEKKENFLEKRGKVEKLTQGFLVFVGILALLWFPLFLLSSANPATTTNGVTEVGLEISVVGWEPLFSISQDEGIEYASDDSFNLIRQLFPFVTSEEEGNTQIITLTPYSSTNWQATLPSQRSLSKSLLDFNGTKDMEMQLRLTFHRPQPTDQQVVVTDVMYTLDPDERQELYDALTFDQKVGSVLLPDFVPSIVDVKLDGSVTMDSNQETATSVYLSLNRTIVDETIYYEDGNAEGAENFMEFWTLLNAEYNETTPDDDYRQARFPQMVIISDEVPLFFSASLAASGIIGIYFAIVLVIGQFLRGYVSDLQTKLVFTEMPEPIDLITMCEDIFIAREDKELVLERELYNELIELYRSPESLIAITRKVKQD